MHKMQDYMKSIKQREHFFNVEKARLGPCRCGAVGCMV